MQTLVDYCRISGKTLMSETRKRLITPKARVSPVLRARSREWQVPVCTPSFFLKAGRQHSNRRQETQTSLSFFLSQQLPTFAKPVQARGLHLAVKPLGQSPRNSSPFRSLLPPGFPVHDLCTLSSDKTDFTVKLQITKHSN